PDLLHHILTINTTAVIAYLNAQIEAGAQAVMIFDTWGGMLTHAAFREFSLAYTARVIAGLKRKHEGVRVPSIVFTKGGGGWLESIAAIGCDAVGLDWTVDIGDARTRIGARVALQGNLDPAILLASPEVIRRECALVLEATTENPRQFWLCAVATPQTYAQQGFAGSRHCATLWLPDESLI
ncbi:MAG: hypothetical protein HYU44_08585, partial [Betaproteobacteria bacterium]|nr:hypothetical protein [Betaproteobacteria bacterium]